jgi:hypothetical protein
MIALSKYTLCIKYTPYNSLTCNMKINFYSIPVATFFITCLLSMLQVSAQDKPAQISKLEIKEKEVYKADSANVLRVDTLIMHDKSAIFFSPMSNAVLEAKVAIIGNKCIISSKGWDGNNSSLYPYGKDGTDGGNLTLVMGLERLGKLTIDARGGQGSQGLNGQHGLPGKPDRLEEKTQIGWNGKPERVKIVVPGEPGTDGTDATSGGNGGNGGNLMLMYSTSGFVPVFNRADRETNSIIILNTAGKGGRSGIPGRGGLGRRNGEIRKTSDIKVIQDGRIELNNINNQIL